MLLINSGAAIYLLGTTPIAANAASNVAAILNGGFEQVSTASGNLSIIGWGPFGEGYQVDSTERHTGRYALRCAATSATASYGAQYHWTLNQTSAWPVVIGSWSKAENVGGSPNTDYSVYADVNFADGSHWWAQTANFDTGTHGWQRRHFVINAPKPIQSMTVYALFRNHSGTVWFDDFDAQEFRGDALFDGQELSAPRVEFGCWYLRDVGAGSEIVPITKAAAFHDVKLSTVSTSLGGKVVYAELRNTSHETRCITIYYAEHFDGLKPVWWDDLRARQSASVDGEYGNLASASVGANGLRSLYPFGCVTADGKGRALGVPPSMQPRVDRIVYNRRSRLLFVAFDIALTAAGDPAGHDHADVAVARYDVDPNWGFRDAAAKFYTLFPAAYERRSTAEGIWMPFTDPSQIDGLADFHIAYHEGDNSVASDRQRGILSFRYVEPMTYWMPMAKDVPRTYDAALDAVRAQAAKPVKDPKSTDYQSDHARQSQAVLASGTRDAHGRYNVVFQNAPWCNGAVWVLNPDPHLPKPPDQWSKARLNGLGEPAFGQPNQPDGEFLDSLEMWADTLDYSTASLEAAREPLTFTPDTFRPVIPTWFSVYEATKALSEDLHRHGKLLMANATPWGFTIYGPLLDVMGTETNMFDNGKFVGEPDSCFNLRRTLCYHKPYLLLLNSDFTKLDEAKIELYFQRCMFYGVFPSMFSADGASNPYWEHPKYYNRDRPLFKKYLPVIAKLSSAGWEPVTDARADRSDVWLERYGNRYLTVLNSTDRAANASITLDRSRFDSGRLRVIDAISGAKIADIDATGPARFSLSLTPSESRVLDVTR